MKMLTLAADSGLLGLVRGHWTIREDGAGPGKATVLETLGTARTILAVQVLFGAGDSEETLDALDPLWNWLQENRSGLLQADGEGYYDLNGLILELE